LGKALKTFLFVSAIALTLLGSATAKGHPKARIVRELSDLKEILSFKSLEDEVYIHSHEWTEVAYGAFADDNNPQTGRPWNMFDVLYVDVPALYEMALSSMAKGEWAEALKILDKCGSEKTPVSKKSFQTTDVYRNHVPHKRFLCHLELGNTEEALSEFDKIYKNKKAHSKAQVMIKALPHLIEAKKGKLANQVADELLKLRLPRRDIVDVMIEKSFALASIKDFNNANKVLDDALDAYGDSYETLAETVEGAKARILVFYKKAYREAINMFNEAIEEKGASAGAYLFKNLGYCLAKTNKWEEARWNYLKAHTIGMSSSETKELLKLIEEANQKVASKEGNAALEAYFKEVQQTL
jgi:tetratricopeptide (TPR) repeat protein